MALSRLNTKLICCHRASNLLLSQSRTFCSDKFDLKVEWNERLKAPIFGVLDMDKYFLDIDRQHGMTGVTSHVDLDIFANGLLISKSSGVLKKKGDIEARLEQMEELLRRFRSTPEAIKMLGSTPHAVVRGAVEGQQTDILMKLLTHRLRYGLILDDYSNTFLIDKFLKVIINKNRGSFYAKYKSLPKTGHLQYLSQDFDKLVSEVNKANFANFLYK